MERTKYIFYAKKRPITSLDFLVDYMRKNESGEFNIFGVLVSDLGLLYI